ncbi:MAG: hypothetical protein J1F07_04895 [Muribaculaceae bacterium]|nr:hypothetical protein [Muribaculaceae bacterium]
MKQKISYSSVLSGLSIAFFVVFIAIFVLCWVFINKPFDNVFFWILFGLFCVGIIWICGSVPYSVNADDDYLGEERPFRTRKYRYSEIKSAQVADGDTYASVDKKHHAHGRFKNPVLITLKDGQQFIIGSEDPTKLVDYINSKVS